MRKPGRFSTIVLGGLAALCFAAVVVALVRTGARLDDPRTVLVYYALPALFGVLLLAALRLPAVARTSLSVTLLAALAGVYATELYLGLGGAAEDRAPPPVPGYDTRTVAEVVDDLAAAGTRAYPVAFGTALLEPDADGGLVSKLRVDGAEVLPLGGISDAVTVYCNEGGTYLIYRSDRHGFHNPPGLWERGAPALAALGDSFTQGACVASDRNFVALVRDRHPGMVNLGMGGNGPLTMLAGLKEYLAALRPEVVLWCYFEGNDVTKDLFREQRVALLMRYLEPGFRQGLADMQPAIDGALIEAVAAARAAAAEPAAGPAPGPGAMDLLLLRHLRHALGLGAGRADLALFERVLVEAERSVAAWGGRLQFVYLPDRRRYAGLAARLEQDSLRQRVLALVEGLGIPVIDLVPAFDAQPDPPALFQGHYNEAGHALAARVVLEALAARAP